MKYYKIKKKDERIYLKPKKVPKDILEFFNIYPPPDEDWEIPILEKDKYYRFISRKTDVIAIFKGYKFIKSIYDTSLEYILDLIRVKEDGTDIPIPNNKIDKLIYSNLSMTSNYNTETDETFFNFNIRANPILIIKSYKNDKELKADLLK